MRSKIPPFLLERQTIPGLKDRRHGLSTSFVEKGLKKLSGIIKTGYIEPEMAPKEGIFVKTDARVKVLIVLFMIITVSLKKDIFSEAIIALSVFALVLISRLDLFNFYRRVIFFGFVFGFLVALPSALTIIKKGEIIIPLVTLSRDYRFWIYHIPQEIGITKEGSLGVIMLTLRVANSVALSYWLLSTTRFSDIIKSLKVFRVPDAFLIIITLTYKYIFIFAKTVEDMHLAMRSRLAATVSGRLARELVAGRIAFVFRKTRTRCEEVFTAMTARGFMNEVSLSGFKKLDAGDLAAGGVLISAEIFFLWI